jgi:mannose-6-phosphate isomerase-like protein (cupin superfamily)
VLQSKWRTAVKQFVVAAGDSRSLKTAVLGGQILVKVSGRDTSGSYAVFEIPTVPVSGPPLHVHEIEDEWFYGLEGEHDFQIGDELFRIGPGGSVFAPKRIPHTWLNVGNSAGKMLTIAQPAGQLEQFFIEFATLVVAGHPDPIKMRQLFETYAMKVVGPPLSVQPESLTDSAATGRKNY